VSLHVAVPLVSPGPLTSAISIIGLLALSAWIAWRFGPTLLRVSGWCSWWTAWACGNQGGVAYCVAFLVLGMLAWGAGTVWYARRRGRWSSPLSRRLLAPLLGKRGITEESELPTVVRTSRRHH
jgi:hypothetical protein